MGISDNVGAPLITPTTRSVAYGAERGVLGKHRRRPRARAGKIELATKNSYQKEQARQQAATLAGRSGMAHDINDISAAVAGDHGGASGAETQSVTRRCREKQAGGLHVSTALCGNQRSTAWQCLAWCDSGGGHGAA